MSRTKALVVTPLVTTLALQLVQMNAAHAVRDCVRDLLVEPSGLVDFDVTGQPMSYQVRLRARPGKTCPYVIHFSTGNAGNLNRTLTKTGASIRYGLFASPCAPAVPNCTNPQLRDSGTTTDVFKGTIPRSGEVVHQFYPVYPLEPVNNLSTSQPLKAWGLYQDTITISGSESDDNGLTYGVTATSTLTLQKTVAKFTTISIVDPGAPYSDPPVQSRTVDFSTLRAGASRSFDLLSLYNAGFQLTVESQNGGRLKATSGAAVVPYEFKVNGAPRALPPATPVVLGSGTGTSSPPGSGTRTQIEVTIPPSSVASALAGTYEDILTVTITSTE